MYRTCCVYGNLQVVLPENSGVCADMNGDGQPDNRLGTVSPVYNLIGLAFAEGADNSVNLLFLFYASKIQTSRRLLNWLRSMLSGLAIVTMFCPRA